MKKTLAVLATAIAITITGSISAEEEEPPPLPSFYNSTLIATNEPKTEPPQYIPEMDPPKLEPKPTDIEGLVKYYSKRYGISPNLPLAICRAESGCRAVPNKSGSSAWGPFQIIDSTARGWGLKRSGGQYESLDSHIEVAVRKISEGQTSHWRQSSSVWQK